MVNALWGKDRQKNRETDFENVATAIDVFSIYT